MRVLGVSDSDSYVKWGAAMLDRLPEEWERRFVVLRTPTLPSAAQLKAALAGTAFAAAGAPLFDLAELAEEVARSRPDVVVLSVRGPVVRVLVRMIVAATDDRPVIVSGLPGISIPETMLALYYRSQADLFVLHSKREIRAFSALAERHGIGQEFALSTLPFLARAGQVTASGDDIVFAAQATVPPDKEDRQRVLEWLAETARRAPHRRVVIKLRAVAGEAQTHAERYPYDSLLERMPGLPANLVVSSGPMARHLERAGALVTVSSTAAIEAIAAHVPVLALTDFGVESRLINTVFEDSGLLADSEALMAGVFTSPHEHWLDDNYFHPAADDTVVPLIEAAVARREVGALALRPQFRAGLGGNLRRVWDRKRALGPYDRSTAGFFALMVGLPLRATVRIMQIARARARS